MLSRPASILAAAALVAVFSFTACETPYRSAYSYRKNNFVPPPKPEPPKPKVANPDALPGSATGVVPGSPDAAIPGIPGLAPAAAPAAAPAGGAAPGTIPGL